MYEMLKLISNLMCSNSDSTLILQGACLKHLPHSIPDIMTVFSATELRLIVNTILNNYLQNVLILIFNSFIFIEVNCLLNSLVMCLHPDW